MDIEATFRLLNEIESDIPVQSWRLGKADAWPILRQKIGDAAVDDSQLPAEKGWVHRSDVFRRILFQLNRRNLDREASVPIKRADYVFVFTGNARVEVRGRFVAKQVHALLEALGRRGRSCLSLENVELATLRIPRATPSAFVSLPVLHACLKVLYPVARALGCARVHAPGLPSLARRLAEAGLDVDIRDFEKTAWYAQRESQYWSRLLQKVRPKAAFVICYYGFGWGLAVACRREGIPLYDLQHGTAGLSHYAYGRWNGAPDKGYTTLPYGFLSWNEADAAAIRDWANHGTGHVSVAIGDPWHTFWDSASAKVAFSREIDDMEKSINRPYVLFTHQNAPDGLPDEILATMRTTSRRLQWGIRFHPTYKDDAALRARIREAVPGIDLRFANELPLPLLLERCALHVTRWSAVVLEAEARGIHSVVLDSRGLGYFRQQVDHGACTFVATGADAADRIVVLAERAAVRDGGASAPRGSGDCRLEDFVDGLIRDEAARRDGSSERSVRA